MRKFYTYTVAVEFEAADEHEALFLLQNTPLNQMTTDILDVEIEEI